MEEEQKMILDDLRRALADNKMNRSLEASVFFLLSDCFGFPVQNVNTEIARIGTPNARVFAWAENDNVEIEITVKRLKRKGVKNDNNV